MDKIWTCVLLGTICVAIVAVATYAYALVIPGEGECWQYWFTYDPCSGCEKVYLGGGAKCVLFDSRGWSTCEVGDSYDFCASLDEVCQEGNFYYWLPDQSGSCFAQCSGDPAGYIWDLEQHILNTYYSGTDTCP